MRKRMRHRRLLRGAALLAASTAGASVLVAVTAPAASADETITIASTQPVYLVNAGGTANIGVKLTFTGTPTVGFVGLDRDVTLTWTLGGSLNVGTGATLRTLPSTATPGVDYTSPTSGTLTFPADTPSGTVVTIPVATAPNSAASVAKTINSTIACTSGCTGVSVSGFTNDPPTVVINAHGFPYLDSSLPVQERVADLMSRMSLADKVGQMTETNESVVSNPSTTSSSSWNNTRAWELGSLLSGGDDNPPVNSPAGWADLVDNIQVRALATPLQIPMIYGEDTVHGNAHMVGATVFPHNIGMGATRDPALSEQQGEVTGQETRSSGPQFGFAPCICVARDIRWGRTYESYGEDPALVSLMETEIDGMQGTNPLDKSGLHIIGSAKHFAGDGATTNGTNAGVVQTTRAQFQALAVSPYIAAVQQHHIGSIMPSYSSVQYTDDPAETTPTKMSARTDLLTDDLKNTIGFDGFLISDWDAINQIPAPNPLPAGVPDRYSYQIMTSFNAGMDMVMAPSQPEFKNFENDLTALVNNGLVPMSRIDDAVQRILTQKFELGVFEQPLTNRSTQDQIGSPAHRSIARQAVQQSQVLLQNTGNVLPLSKTATKVYVAGSNADNVGNQTGGWTITWQGRTGSTPDAPYTTTIRQAIQNVVGAGAVTFSSTATPAPSASDGYDYGIVVVGETPYAEGAGDVPTARSLNLTAADSTAITNVCSAMPCVVLVVSGRPMTLTDAQFAQANAVVESWLPGTEGEGVADVLFGDVAFQGQLPQSWPRTVAQEPINVGDASYDPRFPFGWGLTTGSTEARLRQAVASLSTIAGDTHVSAAVTTLNRLLATPSAWKPDGTVADPAAVVRAAQAAADELAQSSAPTFTQDRGVVAVAREVAQAAALTFGGPDATTSSFVANADDALLRGQPDVAVRLLRRLPFAAIEPLVSQYSTNPDVTTGLTDKLEAAFAAATAQAYNNQLTAFENQLRAQTGKALTADQAANLLSLERALLQ